MHANVLILGGGIIGTSLAAALATRGVKDVVVVDLDLAGVYASSELNAGGARATWWHPVNIETCSATLPFFAEHSERFAEGTHGNVCCSMTYACAVASKCAKRVCFIHHTKEVMLGAQLCEHFRIQQVTIHAEK